MDHLAALQEMYFEDWTTITIELGRSICNNDAVETKRIIQKYFNTPEARPLFDGQIAFKHAEKEEDCSNLAPAFLAVLTSNRMALEAILEFTKNPNARSRSNDDSTWTLLMLAAQHGDIKTVEYLLDVGADPNAMLIHGGANGTTSACTALGFAAEGSYHKTIELLIQRGAKPVIGDVILLIRPDGLVSPALVKLVEENPDLIQQRDGRTDSTLLHHACMVDNLATVEWLLSRGADVNGIKALPGGELFTPLDYALLQENVGLINCLKASGGITKLAVFDVPSEVPSGACEKSEVTSIIERLELLEEKLGISLSGLYASIEQRAWANPSDFGLCINFDVLSTGGEPLHESFYIRAAAYNEAGQVIGKDDVFIHNADFSGFDSKSINMVAAQRPVKIRLFPAK